MSWLVRAANGVRWGRVEQEHPIKPHRHRFVVAKRRTRPTKLKTQCNTAASMEYDLLQTRRRPMPPNSHWSPIFGDICRPCAAPVLLEGQTTIYKGQAPDPVQCIAHHRKEQLGKSLQGRSVITRTNKSIDLAFGPSALLLIAFAIGCSQDKEPFPDGLRLPAPIAIVEPHQDIVADVARASAQYDREHTAHSPINFHNLSLRKSLILAVQHNRSLHQTTYRTQRRGLALPIERRNLNPSFLNGSLAVWESDDDGDVRISTVRRLSGFDFEPFIDFAYGDNRSDNDRMANYGIAVSRQVFRINHEALRQYLPLTRATRDYHVAINQRILELRQLHLHVVELFYDIQRLNTTVEIRNNRVKDAEDFLNIVTVKLEKGIVAAIEQNNAQINLNQARSDFVRGQTKLHNARERLLDLMGLDVTENIRIRKDDLSNFETPELDLASDSDLIMTHHEDVRNQLLAMEVQRQEYRVSLEAISPDLTAKFTATHNVDSNHREQDELRVDLALSLPLDNFNAERAEARQHRLHLMEMAIELADVRSDLLRQLRATHRTIRQLASTVKLAEERLEAERRKLNATLQRYETGTDVDNLEVIRAKETFDQSEVDLLEARIDRIVEQARYQALLPQPFELTSVSFDIDEEPKVPSRQKEVETEPRP